MVNVVQFLYSVVQFSCSVRLCLLLNSAICVQFDAGQYGFYTRFHILHVDLARRAYSVCQKSERGYAKKIYNPKTLRNFRKPNKRGAVAVLRYELS